MAVSPDGRSVASGSSDKTVRVWAAATGEARVTLVGASKGVTALTFSPDGRSLIAGSDDGVARLWSAETGAALAVLAAPPKGGGAARGITSVAFSADGQKVSSCSDDKAVRVWDLSGALLETVEGRLDASSVFSEGGAPPPPHAPHPGDEAFQRLPVAWSLHERWVRVEVKASAGYAVDSPSCLYFPLGTTPLHATAALVRGQSGTPATARLFIVFQEGPVLRFRALLAGEKGGLHVDDSV